MLFLLYLRARDWMRLNFAIVSLGSPKLRWSQEPHLVRMVKGMFVRPEQVDEVLKRHPDIVRGRLVVTRANEQDAMTLHCETAGTDAGLADAVVASVADVTKLKADVELVAPGTLANDGKVIDDTRPIE